MYRYYTCAGVLLPKDPALSIVPRIPDRRQFNPQFTTKTHRRTDKTTERRHKHTEQATGQARVTHTTHHSVSQPSNSATHDQPPPSGPPNTYGTSNPRACWSLLVRVMPSLEVPAPQRMGFSCYVSVREVLWCLWLVSEPTLSFSAVSCESSISWRRATLFLGRW